MIIELNKKVPGCNHFYWHEILYHPKWGCCVFPNEQQYFNLIIITQKVDIIRRHYGAPIVVHNGFRTRIYNNLIGGAKKSMHLIGGALDYHIMGYSCDEVKKELIPMLPELELRMEDNGDGAEWIHNDIKEPSSEKRRFFLP